MKFLVLLTLALQTCAVEKRARVRQMWPRAVSGRSKRTFTVRETLAEASKGTDGVLWSEFNGFGRFRFATLG
ncbi:MAG: hypothetical protein PVI74_11705 [Syntrophobacterales bacterium]